MKTICENCYKRCINKRFLIPQAMLKTAKIILAELPLKSKFGRPSLDHERMLHGIYYLLKTGTHWNGLPRCFGSASAIHRFFQRLVLFSFFKKLWEHEIKEYDKIHGLDLSLQSVDCSHRKSPIAQDKSGKSPVDRRKQGNKLSVLSEKNSIIIGMEIGPSNQHDSKLFYQTLQTVPETLQMPYYKEMHLDSAYDSEEVKTILFNKYYVPKIAPNRRKNKAKPENPLGYSRWFIEPIHSWMNRFRAIYVRFHKYASNYLSLAQFAASMIIFKKI